MNKENQNTDSRSHFEEIVRKLKADLQNEIAKRKKVENELLSRKSTIAQYQEIANMGSYVLDFHSGQWSSTEVLNKIYGIDKNYERNIENWTKIIHPEERENMADYLYKGLLEPQKSLDKEYRIIRINDGKVRWVHGLGKFQLNKMGKPELLLGTVQDITERKEAENKLLINQNFLAKAQEIGKIGTWKLNIKENILEWTDENYKIFDIPPGTYMNLEKFFDLIHPDDKDYVSKKWSEALENKTYDIEHRIIAHDKIKWVREKAQVQFDNQGKPTTAIGVTQDISFRKKSEKKLKEIESKFSAAFYDNPTAMQMINLATGERLAINNSAAKLFDFDINEMYNDNLLNSKIWKNTDTIHEAFKKLKREGSFKNYPLELISKSGESRSILTYSTIIEESDEKIALAAYVDITEQKKIQEQLSTALSELEILKNKIERENIYLQEEIKQEHNFSEIIGQSKSMKKMFNQIELVSNTETAVLILGETGTGKELVARAIHGRSNRHKHPLVKVNCAALPRELIESELFGHEKGAFTGAIEKKLGRFELANKGTIFLDEIGDLPLNLQSRLLRILQENEFERVGSGKTIQVDVRVIAATNRNLEKLVLKGEFRQDLYYRLNVFPITCPNLKDRLDDIPLLVNHFINKFNPRMGKNINTIPQRLINKFIKYNWPGNVRELENVIERAMVINQGDDLFVGDWFEQVSPPSHDTQIKTLAEREKDYILKILKLCNWRIRGKNGAAEILGLKPTTLESRMKKMNIER